VPNIAEPRLSRIVTWVRFHHRATGRQFFVFNTHFTPRSGQMQLDAARIIRERMRTLPAGSAVIVLGDFNAVAEDSAVWRDLTADSLKDAWILAEERHGPPVTMSGFGPPRSGETGRIDWILVSGPMKVRSVETLLYHNGGRYPSDHDPVAARVEVQ
jgi:endonuclease/exonuclease/phosphatase family metal-dependent hydrolase